jgi:hypothetical protein
LSSLSRAPLSLSTARETLDGGNADAQVTKLGSKILSIILIGALWIILITLSDVDSESACVR